MYSKIAYTNVKKSFKDYTIYFLTLVLAVCIFYGFNAIDSQKAIIEASMSDKNYMASFTNMISMISVFVSIILAGLILYANNFLIKRRNKEMGLYMTLGMSKNKISFILFLETMYVGILSLVSGLMLGLLLSQGISVFVANLFESEMSGYRFVISYVALKKTVIYFGVMFFVVMAFNSYKISKYKIIELLTAGRKNEQVTFKSQWVYVISFVLSIGILGTSYQMILKQGFNAGFSMLGMVGGLGIIGTILLFFSLSGFLLYVIKKNKRMYLKGLNIFTIKQINSKVNTNFLSMSIVSLMLFVTMLVLSTGFSFKNSVESRVTKTAPYDISAWVYPNQEPEVTTVKDALAHRGITLSSSTSMVYYNEYFGETMLSDFLQFEDGKEFYDTQVSYMKLSDYNKIREMDKKQPIQLKQEEAVIVSANDSIVSLLQAYVEKQDKISLDGTTFTIKDQKIVTDNLKTSGIATSIVIVVNDNVCDGKTVSASCVNIDFGGDKKQEKEFLDRCKEFHKKDQDYDKIGYIMLFSKATILEDNKGITTKALFIGIYIGVIFLISSMAILALQQLSEASDSIGRYAALKKLGVTRRDMNRTIFKQTAVYFSLPVLVAFIHSIVGIQASKSFLLSYGKGDIGMASVITAIIFLMIYGIYFYVTYSGYKNIIKNNI